MSNILKFLVLPSEVSKFESSYLARMNRVGLAFLALHIPVFTAIAWFNDTGPLLAFGLTLAASVGPFTAFKWLDRPRAVSLVYGITAMLMGGLLAHFGQGPMQIEMHFYFFALIAMLAVFANPMVIVAAAGTVALHHLVVWLVVPRSVFNYSAPVWVVGLHALFVVLESIATCFIARSFFDNVIGLEKVVAARTRDLDRRNAEMRLVLDNVHQGFATIERDGTLSTERSAAFEQWFGPGEAGGTFFDVLDGLGAAFGASSRAAWTEVIDGFMPLALTLDQMPRVVVTSQREMSIEYRPIGEGETPDRFLVVITDVSSQRQRERADIERRETMKVFERLLADRAGCVSFFENTDELIALVAADGYGDDPITYKRHLHTLKGNAAMFGLESIAGLCHEMEDFINEEAASPPTSMRLSINERWQRVANEMDRLLGTRRSVIEIESTEHAELESAVRLRTSNDVLLRMVHSLKLEPTQKRLDAFAEQARQIAERLEKGGIEVKVESNGLRVDATHWAPFWSALAHAIRNAVDHGLERPDERIEGGKSPAGTLALRTYCEKDSFVIEVRDDGRGIDRAKLVDKARALGVEAPEGDAESLLFLDGLSTATEVTDLSGRGIGLGALREAARSLGGVVNVSSEPAKGTCIRFEFPVSAMSPELGVLAWAA